MGLQNTRREFLSLLGGFIAVAPAIVRAESIMPVHALLEPPLIDAEAFLTAEYRLANNRLLDFCVARLATRGWRSHPAIVPASSLMPVRRIVMPWDQASFPVFDTYKVIL